LISIKEIIERKTVVNWLNPHHQLAEHFTAPLRVIAAHQMDRTIEAKPTEVEEQFNAIQIHDRRDCRGCLWRTRCKQRLAQDTVKIGLIVSMTGPQASTGSR
jgi:hypothetical protein